MKMKEAIAKLEADLQKYPYKVTFCFKGSNDPYLPSFLSNLPYTIEKKFADVSEAEEYAEACWKRNPLTFKYVEVIRRQDQMSMLYFDAVNPHGYSKHWEMVMIENYKENYEVWYDRPCRLSNEEILQRLNEECCPWEARLVDVSEWMGI